MNDITTTPDVARRALKGDMHHVAQESIQEAAVMGRKLSVANRRIGELEAKLEETSRELADARMAFDRFVGSR